MGIELVDQLTFPPQLPGVKSATKLARQLAAIRRAHGIVKRKPDEKPLAEWWAEHKREERELEDK
jgi:hypothetical protein